jgi:nitrogen fixation/metabolism regulation signal transduction histidine kinase
MITATKSIFYSAFAIPVILLVGLVVAGTSLESDVTKALFMFLSIPMVIGLVVAVGVLARAWQLFQREQRGERNEEQLAQNYRLHLFFGIALLFPLIALLVLIWSL